MYKIALTQALSSSGMAYLERWAEPYVINSADPAVIEEALAQHPDTDGIICRIAKLPGRVIRNAGNLRVIGRTGVGYDDVDVRTASELGIPVVITPGANSNAVAEYTIATMFALSKGIIASQAAMRRGEYACRFRYDAYELAGKTLLLIGFGHIGRIVARIAKAMGMEVAIYDAYVSPKSVADAGAAWKETLESALPDADFVSLHVPLLPETRGMIGAKEIASMKDGAVILNHARGGLVDEEALVAALQSGKLSGAALDVFVNEPPQADDPILSAPNVLLSAHVAAQTREAKQHMAERCVDGMYAVLQGEQWQAVADKAAYSHERWTHAAGSCSNRNK